MGSIKEISIKNHTHYFFDHMIKIKEFNPDLLKTDKKNHENKHLYLLQGCITMKDSDYVRINSVNPLYIIIGEADGCIEEKNGNKYLIFASTDKNKEVSKKYTEL